VWIINNINYKEKLNVLSVWKVMKELMIDRDNNYEPFLLFLLLSNITKVA